MNILPDLEVSIMPHGLGVQIRGGQYPYVVRGKRTTEAWQYLESQLPHCHDLDSLVESSPDDLRQPVTRLLHMLSTRGLLSTGPQCDLDSHDLSHRQCLFWARQGIESPGSVSPEPKTSLVLVASGLLGATTYDLLSRSGPNQITVLSPAQDTFVQKAVQLSPVKTKLVCLDDAKLEDLLIDSIRACGLVITAVRQPTPGLLEKINQLCLEYDRVWLQGREESGTFEVGPVLYPHRTACHTCVELRRRSRDPFALENTLYQQTRDRLGEGPQGELLPMATLVASLLAVEVSRILKGCQAELHDAVLEIDWTLNPKRHQVIRVPRCPSCYTGRKIDVPYG